MTPKQTEEHLNKEISFLFYPKDWLTDPKLCHCSLAAQGAWMRLICLMWLSNPKGYLNKTWTVTDLSHQVLGDMSVIEELISNDVLRQDENGWFSKRIVEVVADRAKWKERQKNHRLNKKVGKKVGEKCHASVTGLSPTSESQSESQSEETVSSSIFSGSSRQGDLVDMNEED